MLTLDVVVPTYNRRDLLAKTVASLMEAELPDGLAVTVIVVDNNCTDDTASLVRGMKPPGAIRLQYVKEEKQGISNARNGGIAAGSGELVGFVDDDEQVDPAWYNIQYTQLKEEDHPSGLVVVSATHLSGQLLQNHLAYRWLLRYPVKTILDHSLYVFDVPPDAATADGRPSK